MRSKRRRPLAELREVAGFFTREEGEMVAGKKLERDVYGWTDALGAGVGITRSFIVVLYSAGIRGWDDNFQPDVGHPIVTEVAEYFVDLAKNTAPREAQNWGFLEGTRDVPRRSPRDGDHVASGRGHRRDRGRGRRGQCRLLHAAGLGKQPRGLHARHTVPGAAAAC